MSSGGIVALSPAEKDPYRIVGAVRQLMEGRSNATGAVTLTAAATTTAVTAVSCAAGSTVLLQPTTANAAAALATTYIGTVANGSFTITHANNAQTDRSYRWFCVG